MGKIKLLTVESNVDNVSELLYTKFNGFLPYDIHQGNKHPDGRFPYTIVASESDLAKISSRKSSDLLATLGYEQVSSFDRVHYCQVTIKNLPTAIVHRDISDFRQDLEATLGHKLREIRKYKQRSGRFALFFITETEKQARDVARRQFLPLLRFRINTTAHLYLVTEPPLVQCRKCFGLNHTVRECKRSAVCAKCGQLEHSGDCGGLVTCVICKENGHTATGFQCPVKRRPKKSSRTATSAVSRPEAGWHVAGKKRQAPPPPKLSTAEFPPLPAKANPKSGISASKRVATAPKKAATTPAAPLGKLSKPSKRAKKEARRRAAKKLAKGTACTNPSAEQVAKPRPPLKQPAKTGHNSAVAPLTPKIQPNITHNSIRHANPAYTTGHPNDRGFHIALELQAKHFAEEHQLPFAECHNEFLLMNGFPSIIQPDAEMLRRRLDDKAQAKRRRPESLISVSSGCGSPLNPEKRSRFEYCSSNLATIDEPDLTKQPLPKSNSESASESEDSESDDDDDSGSGSDGELAYWRHKFDVKSTEDGSSTSCVILVDKQLASAKQIKKALLNGSVIESDWSNDNLKELGQKLVEGRVRISNILNRRDSPAKN